MEQQALSQQFVQQISNQQQAAPAIPQQQPQVHDELQDVLDDVRTDLSVADVDELGDQVKSWLERS